MNLAPGTRLGSYEIVAPLRPRGMGEAYRARDTRLGRDVALKILPPELAADPQRLQRFEQEARAASSLNHPSIVHVYEVGSFDSIHYVALELVTGRSLREMLSSAPLPVRKVLDMAVEIADGLAKAHAAGIVHGDLKPENLVLTDESHVKILDFSLATLRAAIPELGPGEDSTVAELGTRPGTSVGDVQYLSPEQASGQAVDFRSDQFSLGGILYQMASGRAAFTGKNAPETLAAILRDQPEPLSQVSPALPPILRWIIEERCLAKDPQERYGSTWDLARELGSLREHFSEVSAGPPLVRLALHPWRRRAAALAAVASVVAAAFLIGERAGRTPPAPPPAFRQITFQRGTIWSARFAPDGETVVYGAAWEGRPVEPFSTRLGGPESRAVGFPRAEILGISSSGEMAISLERRFLGGFRYTGTLARVALAGGTPRPVLEDVHWADWGPDGKELAIVRDVAGMSQLEYPIGTVLYSTTGWISYPRVSPAGDLVAFLDHPTGSGNRGSVAIVDRAGRKRTLGSEWPDAQGLAWSVAGDQVWFTASPSGIARALRSVTLAGVERTIQTVLGELTLHDISRSGRVLLGREGIRQTLRGLPPGAQKERDLSALDYSIARDLAQDGRSLLIAEEGEGAGPNYSVYLRRMDSEAPPVRLGEGDGLALSPDGGWVLGLLPSQPRQLIVLPTGTGDVKPLPESGLDYQHSATILPDGKRIVCVGAAPGRAVRVYVQDLDGGKPRPITPEGVSIPSGFHPVSPDGRLVAAIGSDRKALLYPVEGDGEPRAIPGLEAREVPIRFSADGRSLFVFRRGELPARVFRLDVSTGRRELWMEIAPGDAAGIDGITRVLLTPDGRSYAYNAPCYLSELYVADGLR